MKRSGGKRIGALLATAAVLGGIGLAYAQQEQRGATSYAPVDIKEPFTSIMTRMKAAKRDVEKSTPTLWPSVTISLTAQRRVRQCRGASLCRKAFG